MPSQSLRLHFTAALALALSGPGPAAAGWLPEGVLLCSACHARFPQMAADGAGGAYVAWTDTRNEAPSGSRDDTYLQRITAGGEIAPGWPPDGLPVCTAADGQYPSTLALDQAGGLFVAWEDYRGLNLVPGTGGDVYVSRFLADGSIAPGWPANGLPVSQREWNEHFPVLLADDTGGAYVTWDDERDIYLKRLTADGEVAPGWPQDGVPVCTLPGFQGGPDLAPDGTGGVFIVWGDLRDGPIAQYVQRVTASGEIAPGWPVNGVRVMLGCALRGGIVPDGAGGAYLGCGTQAFQDDDYFLQRFTADGSLAPGWPAEGVPVCLAPDERAGLRMVLDGQGGVLLAWSDQRDFFDDDIFALRVRPDGTRSPGWPLDGLRITDNTVFDSFPNMASNRMAGAYLCWEWESNLQGFDRRVAIQHLAENATLVPGWPANGLFIPTVVQSGYPRIVEDGAGGAIVAWEDITEHVRALRIEHDGPVPVQLALVSADAEPSLVRLTWSTASGINLRARVERRTEPTEWQTLAELSPDGSGRLLYEDRTVTPGTRYAYRLSYFEDGREYSTPETWVAVPLAFQLALEGFRPNPAVGSPVVAFTLADQAPAALELLDIAGRRIFSRSLHGLDVGRHELRLDASRSLPPGVYLVRLQQAGRSFLARGVVVR